MAEKNFEYWKRRAKKAYLEGRMKRAEYFKKKAYECEDAP